MLFGKQEKDLVANPSLSSLDEKMTVNFLKVDKMLMDSVTPLAERVRDLEEKSKVMYEMLTEAISRLGPIDVRSTAIRDKLSSLEKDIKTQEEIEGDEMRIVKDNLKGLEENVTNELKVLRSDLREELEQIVHKKVDTTEKTCEESIANAIETVRDDIKVATDDLKEAQEQTVELKIKTTEKLNHENIANAIRTMKSNCEDLKDDLKTDLEVFQKGFINEIKQVQEIVEETSEKNNKLKTKFDLAKTKLDLLEDDFKEFKTVDWGVFKREVQSCGTKLDNLEKTQTALLIKDDNIKDIINKFDAMKGTLEKDAEATKKNVAMNYQRLETMSNSISRLEAKTMINKLKCSYCPRKMGGFIGMNLHMKTVHPDIPFIPHPEQTHETGTTNNEIRNKDSNLRSSSALNVKFKFDNSQCRDPEISELLPIENVLKHKLKLMNQ